MTNQELAIMLLQGVKAYALSVLILEWNLETVIDVLVSAILLHFYS